MPSLRPITEKASNGMVKVGSSGPLPLVDVRWLRAHTADDAVLAVEVGADSAAYFEGHVPGAVPLSWLDDLHDPERRGVPTQQQVERLLGRKGVTAETRLVLYGETDTVHAAYAYWLLRYYRHPHVSLLDGGRAAWTAAGGALVQDVPERPVACYRSPGPDPDLRATRELVLERYVEPSGGRVPCGLPSSGRVHRSGVGVLGLPVLRHRLGGHVPGARTSRTPTCSTPPRVVSRPVRCCASGSPG